MGVHTSELLIFHIMDYAYLLTWVTQTSHGKCLFVCVLFYNLAVLKDLRCAMLPDYTVIYIRGMFKNMNKSISK